MHSNAYVPWTPDYTLFILGPYVYLNFPYFTFVSMDCMISRKTILVC